MLLYMPPLWEATIFHSSLHTVHQFTGGNYRHFFETVVGHPKGAEVFRISCLVGLLVCGKHGRAIGNLCSNLYPPASVNGTHPNLCLHSRRRF